MPIHLPFTNYRFTFKALDYLTLPEYSGTLWHSVVGKALHDISCIVPQGDCQRCLFAQQCDYPALFKGVKPRDSKIMKRYQTIPAPHIFRVPLPYRYSVNAQQHFSVNVILFGTTNERLLRLIHAMQKVGDNGFHNARKKAQLIEVVQKNPHGMDQHIALQSTTAQPTMMPQAMPPISIPDVIPKQLRLTFISPFRPTGEAIQSTRFLLNKFIMALIRRVSLLHYFYMQQELKEDYQALKQHAEQLPLLQHTLQWKRHEALAKRRNQHKQGYAWSGSMDIDLTQHQALWPYLYLGQWLHVGKNASMGFGRYQLVEI